MEGGGKYQAKNNKMAFHEYDSSYEHVKHSRRHESGPSDYNPPIHTSTSSADSRYDPGGYDAPTHPYEPGLLRRTRPIDTRSPGRCPGRYNHPPACRPAGPA